MTQFDAIIFDMDGLLLDTERIALATFLDACAELGLSARTDLFMQCLGTNEALGSEVLKAGFAGCADHTEFERVWDRRYLEATSSEPIPLKAGALALLVHVSTLQIPMAVATSTRTGRAREKLSLANILDQFREVVGGDQVANSKPAPDIYLEAASRLHARPRACLALEDSEYGVRAAIAAGMTVVQVPDLIAPSAEVLALGHVIVPSLNDVATYPFPHEWGLAR